MDEKGISQRELSRRLQMRSTYLSKILLGTRTVEFVELIDISKELGTTAQRLLDMVLQPDPT